MRDRAVAMLRVDKILASLEEDDRRAVAFEVYRTYGGPLTDAERAQRYRERHAYVIGERDDAVTKLRDGEAQPGPYVSVVLDSSGSKKKQELLTTASLATAKTLLTPGDFDFLQACPEPYRTAWLVDAEWWVSLRDGYPKINAQQQASRYMAWPGAKKKRDHRAALRNWFSTADRWRERDEERRAVR